MAKYLVDVNLPKKFVHWNNENFIFQVDINPTAQDHEIWAYAKNKNLTILTKDSDFSDKIIHSDPPPKVIHFKFGNLKMIDFHAQSSKLYHSLIDIPCSTFSPCSCKDHV